MKPKVGDEITAVYSRLEKRYVLFLKVTKIGRLYIYGMTLYTNQEGTVSNGHEVKLVTKLTTFYPGLRHDLREAELKYRAEDQGWIYQRNEKEKELVWEFRDHLRAQMDAWKLENPRPQRSEPLREVTV